MKGKVAILRLSPNEEDRILREEYERRRKLRIQQVREQQRLIALKIRREVEQRRQQELEQLGKELKEKWEREQCEKINTLQKLYQESLQLLGQGQRSAKENEPDWAAIARKEEENHAKAEERFREALKELKSQKLQEYERQSRSINARKKALEAEKERSARVAGLPLPPPNPIQNIDFKKPHRIKMSDVNAFATTYYHMADRIVDREVDQIKPNAHEEAEVELERLQQMEMEKMRRREEQLEKAHLRGKQALRREHLEQDCGRLLVELEHMQQTDQLRRRQQVAKMPPQIFQPLYKRAEMKEDFQRQMEFAFEDMYTEERRVKGDLVVQLVPEPLPELSTGSQDQELDVTLDEVAPPMSENTQPDTEQGAGTSEQESSTQVEQTKHASKHPLKKLLDRIRSQRNQWTEHEAAVDLPAVITDEIPEKDTTIDTGSLISEEKSNELPELHRTTHNGPETSEQPTAADTRLPDERSKRHEERKKLDEELEREKLEQLALLQELEGQKAKLEQLLKSQQESNRLHVTHEEDRPESFISDHEVSSAEATDFMLPPDEDDHARQIREYQHRLLERNRIHQRYLEVARKRLEEYRKALQMRYKMAAEKVLPRPHLCTQSSQAAAGLLRLTNSVLQASSHDKAQTSRVISTRESVPVWESRPPDTRSVPDVEPFLSNLRYRSTDGSVVTERLRDRLKPVSVTNEPQEELPSHLTNIPDTIQTICPSVKDIPVRAPVQTGALPQDSVHMLSVGPMEDPILRQTEEQQAVVLQHRQQHERHTWEVEQIRQQKQYLQALIHIDAQTEPLTEATPEEDVCVGQSRRSLLESLLKAIEQRNGGTLSHLEDSQADKGEAPIQSGMLPQCSMLDESLSPTGEMKGQVLGQREPAELYPEEKERGWEMDTEFRRRRKEMPVPEPATEQLVSEDISQIRRKLFASLLKAIAETNEGTLSQSQTAQKDDKTVFNSEAISQNVSAGPPPASIHPEGLRFPPQATRPPVTRVKSAVWEMSRQHELSAIPEVETPVNTSLVTGLEDSPRLPSRGVDQDPLEESDWTRLKSCGQQIYEQSMSSETSSGSSGHLVWAESLLSSSESSPQCSVADSKITSPLSSDSGRGADYSGPAATTFRSSPEAALGAACPESDSLSITTVSTGSYVTTDPEQNSDKSPTLIRVGQGAELLAVFSPPSESICVKDSAAAGSPHLAVERLFSDSGIQRIIDKYTKELNFSLCSPGRPTAECGGLAMQALGASAADQSALLDVERDERTESSPVCESVPSDNAAAQGNSPQWAGAASPVQEQDSFRPLIGQPADQSSCRTADQRDSAIEHLVGQPSAHSSLIGQLPGLQFSVSLDHSGWDSTLTRMMGRFARQSICQWQTGGQGPSDLPTMGQLSSEHLTTWLDGGPEESQMQPLVEQLDESAGQQIESSGERTLVDLGGSNEVTVLSHPEFLPTASVLDAAPHPQAQTIPSDTGPERIEVWDSFHPLMAEVTHNETADPSVNFPQPEHNSPDEQPSSRDPRAPASFSSDDLSESERSLDFFRAEDAATSVMTPPASHESFSLLITSQDHVHESVLLSPLKDVEATAPSLSKLATCSDAPVANTTQPQEPVSSGSVDKLTSEEEADMQDAEELLQSQDSAGEKGILEQSQITLVSLTDTSLQDQDATLTDEAGSWGDEHPDVETESTLPAQPHDKGRALPVTLEVAWGPHSGQQKVLQRVEELKNKRAQSKSRSDAREQLENKSCQPQVKCKAKVDTGPKAGQAERPQTAVNSGLLLRKPPLTEAPEVDPRFCTTEQRKLEVAEMHQRTRRLYEQLEEVQQQKAVKSRQEASTQNRLKAKEFHKKTLQKLRAKQTPC